MKVQTITISGTPAGGATLTVTGGGQPTTALPTSATGAELQAAIAALPAVGVGNVAVIGPAGGPWECTFKGALGAQNLPQMTAQLSAGSGATVAVATTVQGAAHMDEDILIVSRNGVNLVSTTVGRVVVWDKGWLYEMALADFLQKYTPIP